tara:strand:- start:3851 stop:4606 length:756 start_codon:yes stop_codon:yes gene_type:complete
MPNWCTNSTVFTGKEENIAKLKEDLTRPLKVKTSNYGWDILEGDGDDFEPIKDYEMFFYRTKEALPKEWKNGFESNIEYLGSKWGACSPVETEEDSDPDTLVLHYESAWGPCTKGMARVAFHYGLDMFTTYQESGMDFSGVDKYTHDDCSVRSWEGKYVDLEIGIEQFGELTGDSPLAFREDIDWQAFIIAEVNSHYLSPEEFGDEGSEDYDEHLKFLLEETNRVMELMKLTKEDFEMTTSSRDLSEFLEE